MEHESLLSLGCFVACKKGVSHPITAGNFCGEVCKVKLWQHCTFAPMYKSDGHIAIYLQFFFSLFLLCPLWEKKIVLFKSA